MAALVMLVLGSAGWLFRYAYLSPIVVPDHDNPRERAVVVCKVNRWTGYKTCETVIPDIDEIVADFERARESREKK